MNPKVYIIILNWNGLEDTLECLESVFRMDYGNFKVVVVDNGSTDDSVAIIRKTYPNVIIIENKENLGYTGGNNIGMQHALKNGADYVWLLNNDTVVEIDTLSKLVDRGESSPQVGLLSPVIYYYDSPNKIQVYAYYVDWENFAFIGAKNIKSWDGMKTNQMISLFGTALLMKNSVIKEIGYLNEQYFAYYEDYEYCIRAQKVGFECIVEPMAKVFHKGSKSTGSLNAPLQIFLRTRNIYFFWMANLRGFDKLRFFKKFMCDRISAAAALKNENIVESAEACFDGAWWAICRIGGPWNKNLRTPFLMKQILSWHPYFWVSLIRGDFRGIISEVLKRAKHKILRIKN